MMAGARQLGITVLPEYLPTEGIGRVLDNLERVGATAVATSPYVMEPADEATGGREPPMDGGAGGVRLLDRPLWGRRALFVRTAPSFVPDRALYEGLRYQPPAADELTRREGEVIDRFLEQAKGRGFQVFFQIQAASPPGYRVQFTGVACEDEPRLPDGRKVEVRVDRNGSLASPHIRAYGAALIRDLFRRYPALDGVRVDWPEYPPYSFDSLWYDFSVHACEAAERLGFDCARMQADTLALHRRLLGGLRASDLTPWRERDGGRARLLALLIDHPGVLDLLRLKARLSEELLEGLRRAITEAGGPGKQLIAYAFPPPWSLVSGMDYARAARHCQGIAVKLYTMHWPMILRAYGDALREANRRLPPELLLRALVRWLDLADDDGLSRLEDYRYPEPDEPHPVGLEAQARKLREAQARAGACPVQALGHGYGPIEDVRARLQVAMESAGGRLWVNRYGYLSDAKLAMLGELTSGG